MNCTVIAIITRGGNQIRDGRGVQDAFDPKEPGQNDHQGDKADDIAGQRGDHGVDGLAHGLEKDRGHLDGAGEDHQGQEDPEGHFREFPVVAGVGHIGGLTEHSYHKPGRKFKNQGRYESDDHCGSHRVAVGQLDPLVVSGSKIITDDRLTAQDDADHDIDDEGKDLALNPDDGDGDVHPVLGERAVLGQHDITDQGDDHNGYLGDKRGGPQF